MSMIRYTILGMLMFWSIPSLAQDNLTGIDIKNLVKEKIDELQYHLSQIARKDILSDNQRLHEVEAAKALFLGGCETYQVRNEYGDLVSKSPVKIELSSTKKARISRLFVKTFLNNLFRNVNRFGTIELSGLDIVRFDQLTQTPTGTYEAVLYYIPKFGCVERDNKFIYNDSSIRKMILQIESCPEMEDNCACTIKFGDIYSICSSEFF